MLISVIFLSYLRYIVIGFSTSIFDLTSPRPEGTDLEVWSRHDKNLQIIYSSVVRLSVLGRTAARLLEGFLSVL